MQDRQARNKDPYVSTDESSDSAWEGQNRKFDVYELGYSLTPPYLLCLGLTRVTCSEFMRHERQDDPKADKAIATAKTPLPESRGGEKPLLCWTIRSC